MDAVYVKQGNRYEIVRRDMLREGEEFVTKTPPGKVRLFINHARGKPGGWRRPNHAAVQPDEQYFEPYWNGDDGKDLPAVALKGTPKEREATVRAMMEEHHKTTDVDVGSNGLGF